MEQLQRSTSAASSEFGTQCAGSTIANTNAHLGHSQYRPLIRLASVVGDVADRAGVYDEQCKPIAAQARRLCGNFEALSNVSVYAPSNALATQQFASSLLSSASGLQARSNKPYSSAESLRERVDACDALFVDSALSKQDAELLRSIQLLRGSLELLNFEIVAIVHSALHSLRQCSASSALHDADGPALRDSNRDSVESQSFDLFESTDLTDEDFAPTSSHYLDAKSMRNSLHDDRPRYDPHEAPDDDRPVVSASVSHTTSPHPEHQEIHMRSRENGAYLMGRGKPSINPYMHDRSTLATPDAQTAVLEDSTRTALEQAQQVVELELLSQSEKTSVDKDKQKQRKEKPWKRSNWRTFVRNSNGGSNGKDNIHSALARISITELAIDDSTDLVEAIESNCSEASNAVYYPVNDDSEAQAKRKAVIAKAMREHRTRSVSWLVRCARFHDSSAIALRSLRHFVRRDAEPHKDRIANALVLQEPNIVPFLLMLVKHEDCSEEVRQEGALLLGELCIASPSAVEEKRKDMLMYDRNLCQHLLYQLSSNSKYSEHEASAAAIASLASGPQRRNDEMRRNELVLKKQVQSTMLQHLHIYLASLRRCEAGKFPADREGSDAKATKHLGYIAASCARALFMLTLSSENQDREEQPTVQERVEAVLDARSRDGESNLFHSLVQLAGQPGADATLRGLCLAIFVNILRNTDQPSAAKTDLLEDVSSALCEALLQTGSYVAEDETPMSIILRSFAAYALAWASAHPHGKCIQEYLYAHLDQLIDVLAPMLQERGCIGTTASASALATLSNLLCMHKNSLLDVQDIATFIWSKERCLHGLLARVGMGADSTERKLALDLLHTLLKVTTSASTKMEKTTANDSDDARLFEERCELLVNFGLLQRTKQMLRKAKRPSESARVANTAMDPNGDVCSAALLLHTVLMGSERGSLRWRRRVSVTIQSKVCAALLKCSISNTTASIAACQLVERILSSNEACSNIEFAWRSDSLVNQGCAELLGQIALQFQSGSNEVKDDTERAWTHALSALKHLTLGQPSRSRDQRLDHIASSQSAMKAVNRPGDFHGLSFIVSLCCSHSPSPTFETRLQRLFENPSEGIDLFGLLIDELDGSDSAVTIALQGIRCLCSAPAAATGPHRVAMMMEKGVLAKLVSIASSDMSNTQFQTEGASVIAAAALRNIFAHCSSIGANRVSAAVERNKVVNELSHAFSKCVEPAKPESAELLCALVNATSASYVSKQQEQLVNMFTSGPRGRKLIRALKDFSTHARRKSQKADLQLARFLTNAANGEDSQALHIRRNELARAGAVYLLSAFLQDSIPCLRYQALLALRNFTKSIKNKRSRAQDGKDWLWHSLLQCEMRTLLEQTLKENTAQDTFLAEQKPISPFSVQGGSYEEAIQQIASELIPVIRSLEDLQLAELPESDKPFEEEEEDDDDDEGGGGDDDFESRYKKNSFWGVSQQQPDIEQLRAKLQADDEEGDRVNDALEEVQALAHQGDEQAHLSSSLVPDIVNVISCSGISRRRLNALHAAMAAMHMQQEQQESLKDWYDNGHIAQIATVLNHTNAEQSVVSAEEQEMASAAIADYVSGDHRASSLEERRDAIAADDTLLQSLFQGVASGAPAMQHCARTLRNLTLISSDDVQSLTADQRREQRCNKLCSHLHLPSSLAKALLSGDESAADRSMGLVEGKREILLLLRHISTGQETSGKDWRKDTMCSSEELVEALISGISTHVQGADSDVIKRELACIRSLTNGPIDDARDERIHTFVRSDALNKLVQVARWPYGSEGARKHAVGALKNMAIGASPDAAEARRDTLARLGAPKLLVDLALDPSKVVREGEMDDFGERKQQPQQQNNSKVPAEEADMSVSTESSTQLNEGWTFSGWKPLTREDDVLLERESDVRTEQNECRKLAMAALKTLVEGPAMSRTRDERRAWISSTSAVAFANLAADREPEIRRKTASVVERLAKGTNRHKRIRELKSEGVLEILRSMLESPHERSDVRQQAQSALQSL